MFVNSCMNKIIYLVVLVFVMTGLFLGVHHLYQAIPHAGLGIDDANIFFVYGRNIRHGFGFVYNPGGERVEGFTSLAWALVCAVAFFLKTPERALLLINGILVSISLSLLIFRLGKQEKDAKKAFFIPLAALAVGGWTFTAPEFFSWCVLSLMETGLWSAGLMLCLCTLAGSIAGRRIDRMVFPAAIGGLLLIRPESMAWGAGFIGLHFLVSRAGSGRPFLALRKTAPAACTYVTVLAGLTVFRLLYFGFPFPNTYYAKVSPDRLYSLREGWIYFSAFLETNGWLPVLLSAAVLVAAGWTLAGLVACYRKRTLHLNEWDVMAYAGSAAILIGLLIPIWVGGDHFASFRFYQPVWPLLPIPLCYLVSRLVQGLLRRWGTRITEGHQRLLLSAVNLLLALFLTRSFMLSNNAKWDRLEKSELHVDYEVAYDGRYFGETLNQLFEGIPPPSMGAITAGGFKLAYRGEVIDLMGLNNVAMGHAPGERKGIKNHAAFNKDVFYLLQPDVMPLALLRPDEISTPLTLDHPQVQRCIQHKWARLPLKDLFTDEAFHQAYTLVYLARANSPDGPGLLAFASNSYLTALRQNSGRLLISEESRTNTPDV